MRRYSVRLFLLPLVALGLQLSGLSADAGVTDQLRRATENLDPAGMSNDILIDRVLPMAALGEADGTPGAAPVPPARLRQILHELRLASRDVPAWPSAAELREAGRAADPIALALVDLAYDRIRPEALGEGLLAWQGEHLVAAAGAAAERIYLTQRVFAASALLARTTRGAALRFRLDESHLIADRAAALAIDCDDGLGWRPLLPGEILEVAHTETGAKSMRIRATLPGGESLVSSFPFQVDALRTPPPTETWTVTASIPYLNQYASGDAFIYLADGHAELTDPVIVVEGFDLDDSLGWDELYLLLNQEGMLEQLRAEGFDAVVLNFHAATDYMQRNSYLLVELISQVQAAIANDTDIAIVGASMGGVISRFALAYMEDQAIAHRVRNFISFDAPQAGANIPLGIQYWLALFQIESSEAEQLLSLLDRPAARQLLLYHYSLPPDPNGVPDLLRESFLNQLAALGDYPQQPRMVAAANGSGSRIPQGFGAGDQIISYEYYSWLVDLIGNVWAVPAGGQQLILEGLINRIWPLSDDELMVTVAGTKPWDSAPGGWRDSMRQMDEVDAPYGDIVALHQNHCFIPTISALDLDVADPFFDFDSVEDILALSPFDAVYYPHTNEEHIFVSAESKEWFLAEIRRDLTGLPAVADAAPLALASYPNPFNPKTTIAFTMPAAGEARLAIVDVSGREVRSLLDGPLGAGEQAIVWDGKDAAERPSSSGVYFARLTTASGSATSALVLLK